MHVHVQFLSVTLCISILICSASAQVCLRSHGPYGFAPCTTCPAGTGGACGIGGRCSFLSDCRCDIGTYGPDGGPCQSCPANKGIRCGMLSDNNERCNYISECQCNPGYEYVVSSGLCIACTAGKYKSADTNVVCTACPAGLTSPVASSATTACTCNAGYTNPQPYSVTACYRFMTLKISARSFVSVVNKNNPAIGTLPTYNPSGGPNGNGQVSFNRASSQFINGGSWNANVLSNGGFTFVVVLRPTSSIVPNNVIFRGSNSNHIQYIQVAVSGTDNSILFTIIQGGENIAQSVATNNVLTLNTWVTVVCMYKASNIRTEIYINGVLNVGGSLGIPVLDKAMSYTYVANNPDSTSFWNGDMAGLFVVDELLSLSAATNIATSMSNGVDMTSVDCSIGAMCIQCPAGTYKPTTDSVACTNCIAGKTSPVGSTSSAACFVPDCSAGYTGPSGSCTACVAGKYKIATGSAVCTDCGAGTYSATVGATVATTCLTCPTSSNSPVASTALAVCTCNVGFTGLNGGVCTACVAGKYKITTGSASCTDCGTGTYSTTAAASAVTACLACPANSGASCTGCSAAASCTCNPGFALLNSACVCAIGYEPIA